MNDFDSPDAPPSLHLVSLQAPAGDELDVIQNALQDPNATHVQVRRREGGEWRYLRPQIAVEDVSGDVGSLLERIEELHGGGEVELRVMRRDPATNRVHYHAQRVTRIAGPPRPPQPAQQPHVPAAAAAPTAGPTPDLRDLLAGIKAELMAEVRAALQPAPSVAVSPVQQLRELSEVFANLAPARADSAAAEIAELRAEIRAMRSGSSGDMSAAEVFRAIRFGMEMHHPVPPEGPSLAEAIPAAVGQFTEVLTKHQDLQREELELRKRMIGSGRTPASAQTAPLPAWLLKARPYIPFLAGWAAAGADVTDRAETVMGMIDDSDFHLLAADVAAGSFVERTLRAMPRATEQQTAWFRAFFEEVERRVTEGEGEEVGDAS